MFYEVLMEKRAQRELEKTATNRPLIGAGIGSLAGAGIGYLSGSDATKDRKGTRLRNALIGGFGGGILGAAGGSIEDMNQELQGMHKADRARKAAQKAKEVADFNAAEEARVAASFAADRAKKAAQRAKRKAQAQAIRQSQ